MGSDHFKGQNPLGHVLDVQKKGKSLALEFHGIDAPGHLVSFLDAIKDTSLLFVLLKIALGAWSLSAVLIMKILICVCVGWLLWRMGRSALTEWARLKRMHRMIEEERWEIEHHRPQEREELRALYNAKGFSGSFLEEVVDVLMADDNRLLQVMLQEELSLPLEAQEHPLKQAVGAGLGVLVSSAILLPSFYFLSPFWTLCSAGILIGVSAMIMAHVHKNSPVTALIWTLSVAALASGVLHFITQLLA